MNKDKPPVSKTGSQEDISFSEAMHDVRPLKTSNKIQPYKKKPSPRPRQRFQDEQQVLIDMLSDPNPEDLETGDELFFARAGLQTKAIKKLRRGEFTIEAECDLHGLTKQEARLAIIDFLQECQRLNLRCVRIIHGKGLGSAQNKAVLKQYVNYWMQQRDDVLAFASCRPADGGTGAMYVLLKRR